MLNLFCPACDKRVAGTWAFCPACGSKLPEQPAALKKPRVRGNGQGSVYQDAHGRWVAQKVCGYKTTPTGKAVAVYARQGGFTTKRSALAALPDLTRKSQHAEITTLAQAFDGWKNDYARRGRKEKTAAGYESAFAYFAELHALPLSEIGIDDVQECVDNCPHGKRTRQMMRGVMSQIYKYAIPRRLSHDDTNLATYLFCAGDPAAPRSRFTDDELARLRNAIGRVPFAEYVYANCYLGYRPGEFVALDCAHYDYDLEYFKAGAKTEAGKDRAVTISPKIRDIVDEALGGRTSGPVWRDTDGKRMRYERWREIFMCVLDALGIPTRNHPAPDGRVLSPHCCRHTARSLMDHAAGTELAKMAIIGHASDEMSKRYTHQELQHLREVTDTM